MDRGDLQDKIQGALNPADPKVNIRLHDDSNHDWRKKSVEREDYYGKSIYVDSAWDTANKLVLILSSPASLLLVLSRLIPFLSSLFVSYAIPSVATLFIVWLLGNRQMSGFKKLVAFGLISISIINYYEIRYPEPSPNIVELGDWN